MGSSVKIFMSLLHFDSSREVKSAQFHLKFTQRGEFALKNYLLWGAVFFLRVHYFRSIP